MCTEKCIRHELTQSLCPCHVTSNFVVTPSTVHVMLQVVLWITCPCLVTISFVLTHPYRPCYVTSSFVVTPPLLSMCCSQPLVEGKPAAPSARLVKATVNVWVAVTVWVRVNVWVATALDWNSRVWKKPGCTSCPSGPLSADCWPLG